MDKFIPMLSREAEAAPTRPESFFMTNIDAIVKQLANAISEEVIHRVQKQTGKISKAKPVVMSVEPKRRGRPPGVAKVKAVKATRRLS